MTDRFYQNMPAPLYLLSDLEPDALLVEMEHAAIAASVEVDSTASSSPDGLL